jgi:hypothetical protein
MDRSDLYADPHEALADIRKMMARSGRFLSLSGLSGIWAGLCALGASAYAYWQAGTTPFSGLDYFTAYSRASGHSIADVEPFVLTTGIITMLLALIGAVYFTRRRSQQIGNPLWNSTSRAMLLTMLLPLMVGGILVIAHWTHEDYGYSASLTLVFYGLSLLAGSRYTPDEIRFLGYSEIALGLVTAFFPGYGIDSWAIGFGILHILYGLVMYYRYETQA